MISNSVQWISMGCRIPGALSRAFRKKLIDDRIPHAAFMISMVHAYVSGQIVCVPDGNFKGTNTQFAKRGDITEFHVRIKTTEGQIINPILISEDYFFE